MSKVNSKHGDKANESGETYLKGRKAGVEGTYGKKRPGHSAEETNVADKMDQSDSGSLQSDLTSAASSIYSRAVGPGEDPSKMGDQALRDR
jgi:hypothetical protein